MKKTTYKSFSKLVYLCLLVFILFSACRYDKKTEKTPIIYITDLYHPYADPDDHFDLAAIYAIDEFDVRAVIIDYTRPWGNPGIIPIEQLSSITKRKFPVYLGLYEKLKSPDDTGEDQAAYQDGVEIILKELEKSEEKITIFSVGSARDVSAAYNRNPQLFESKVEKLVLFIGEATVTEFIEFNVSLDKQAFINVMNNVPNIWWVPCFDGGIENPGTGEVMNNNGLASFWTASRSELMKNASDPVINYFIYCFSRSKDTVNYIDYLFQPVNKDSLYTYITNPSIKERNLWCCSVFPYFVDKDKTKYPFTFNEVNVSVNEKAELNYTEDGNKMLRFEVTDKDSYKQRMTDIFTELGKNLNDKH